MDVPRRTRGSASHVDPPTRRYADTPIRSSPPPTRFFLVSRHKARHDRLAMHKTRILWCFGLSLLLCGISLQAARSEELEPKKNESATDSAPPLSPLDVPINPV